MGQINCINEMTIYEYFIIVSNDYVYFFKNILRLNLFNWTRCINVSTEKKLCIIDWQKGIYCHKFIIYKDFREAHI